MLLVSLHAPSGQQVSQSCCAAFFDGRFAWDQLRYIQFERYQTIGREAALHVTGCDLRARPEYQGQSEEVRVKKKGSHARG